jgi:hypothetical protein
VFLITFDTELEPASKKKIWECDPGKWQITDNEKLNYVINFAILNYALRYYSSRIRLYDVFLTIFHLVLFSFWHR